MATKTGPPKRRGRYDEDMLVQLLAEGQISYRKIAEKVGVSPSTVSAIARGVKRRDLTDRVDSLVADGIRRMKRLVSSCSRAVMARQIKLALEGDGEPARKAREFILRLAYKDPDPAGAFIGQARGAGGRANFVSRADLDLIAAVHGGAGAPKLNDLPKRTRRELAALVAQDPDAFSTNATPDADAAEIEIDHALTTQEKEAERLAKNAAQLAEAEKIGPAIDQLTRAIDRRRSHAPYYLARGKLYDLVGQHETALANLDRAVKLNFDNPAHWRARGLSRYLNGQYDNALDDFNNAILREPQSPENFLLRGRIFISCEQPSIAVNDFKRALARMPDLPGCDPAALWLCVAQDREGSRNGSKELREFLATRKKDDGTWMMPVARMFLGKIDRKECIAAVANSDPKIHDHQTCNAHFHVGQYYLIFGERAKALAHFDQAISIGPARTAECARYAAEQTAEKYSDPVKAAQAARRAGLSEYPAAVVERRNLIESGNIYDEHRETGYPA